MIGDSGTSTHDDLRLAFISFTDFSLTGRSSSSMKARYQRPGPVSSGRISYLWHWAWRLNSRLCCSKHLGREHYHKHSNIPLQPTMKDKKSQNGEEVA